MVELPLSVAVEKVIQSEITHAPSCVAILEAERLLSTRPR
jgi:hypothetical protein